MTMSPFTYCLELAGEAINQLRSTSILVIGDLILDSYTRGKVSRISPEAPIPVVHTVDDDFIRVGGAGNVAMNLLSCGVNVHLLGRVGTDSSGNVVQQLLESAGCTLNLITQEGYITPTKNRIIAHGQQLVRIDRELPASPTPLGIEALIKAFTKLLPTVQLVLFSDYDKGLLTPLLLEKMLFSAKEYGIPTLIDPKRHNFSVYRGATYLKPNRGEAYRAAHAHDEESLSVVFQRLFVETDATGLIITLADRGIAWALRGEEHQTLPTEVHAVHDVTGAGDTVSAILSMGLASNIPMKQAIGLANVAAGLAVQQSGCAVISLSDLKTAIYEKSSLPVLSRK